jgi:hypothetical protein
LNTRKGVRTEIRALDGAEHEVQVPRLDRAALLQDQADQGQQVVLGDPLEEIPGHLQWQLDQAGRRNRRVQSLPGQVQPCPTDPRRAAKPAGLGDAILQEVTGDRCGQVRLALVEDAEGDIAQGLGVLKPRGGHVAESERGLRGDPVGLLVSGEAVPRMPQVKLPVRRLEAECLPQRAYGRGGSGLIGGGHRFLPGHGTRIPLFVGRAPSGEMFQTSTSRQPSLHS